jgi:hypothetical protein
MVHSDDGAWWRGVTTAMAVVLIALDGIFLAVVCDRGASFDDAAVVVGQVVRVEPHGRRKPRRIENVTIVVPAVCSVPLVGLEVPRASILQGAAIDVACADQIAMPAADRLAPATRHTISALLLAVVALAFVAGGVITPSVPRGVVSMAVFAFIGPTVIHGVLANALADATALGDATAFDVGTRRLLLTLPTMLMPFVAFAGLAWRWSPQCSNAHRRGARRP